MAVRRPDRPGALEKAILEVQIENIPQRVETTPVSAVARPTPGARENPDPPR